jgi:hypothetical protein
MSASRLDRCAVDAQPGARLLICCLLGDRGRAHLAATAPDSLARILDDPVMTRPLRVGIVGLGRIFVCTLRGWEPQPILDR